MNSMTQRAESCPGAVRANIVPLDEGGVYPASRSGGAAAKEDLSTGAITGAAIPGDNISRARCRPADAVIGGRSNGRADRIASDADGAIAQPAEIVSDERAAGH